MILIDSLQDILKINKTVPKLGLTIGNFDGVHLGHQLMLKKIKEECDKKALKLVVITFNPHPQKILNPGKVKFLINTYDQRKKILSNLGVDYFVEIPFTRDFSTLNAEEFLERYIFPYPLVETFFMGYDFAFGANKKGDHTVVKNLCLNKGINIEIQPKFELNDIAISSSLIRSNILEGNLTFVTSVLGRNYSLEGFVIKGEGRGKKIGFPTANIQCADDVIIPQKGVYVTRTHYKNIVHNSITNIGNNPTFKNDNSLNIETNIFSFSQDIYGEKLEIDFLFKIRDEQKFSNVEDLINQISRDVEIAKKYLQNL